MSLHKSLRAQNKHSRTRNVLTREEQIEKLMEDDEWEEGDSVFGLPKVKVETVTLRKKAEEEEEEEAVEGEEALAAEGEEAEGEAETAEVEA